MWDIAERWSRKHILRRHSARGSGDVGLLVNLLNVYIRRRRREIYARRSDIVCGSKKSLNGEDGIPDFRSDLYPTTWRARRLIHHHLSPRDLPAQAYFFTSTFHSWQLQQPGNWFDTLRPGDEISVCLRARVRQFSFFISKAVSSGSADGEK